YKPLPFLQRLAAKRLRKGRCAYRGQCARGLALELPLQPRALAGTRRRRLRRTACVRPRPAGPDRRHKRDPKRPGAGRASVKRPRDRVARPVASGPPSLSPPVYKFYSFMRLLAAPFRLPGRRHGNMNLRIVMTTLRSVAAVASKYWRTRYI